MSLPKRTFADYESWMLAVDRACYNRAGCSIHDLPDVPTRDWYEDGDTPLAVAKRAIRAARDND